MFGLGKIKDDIEKFELTLANLEKNIVKCHKRIEKVETSDKNLLNASELQKQLETYKSLFSTLTGFMIRLLVQHFPEEFKKIDEEQSENGDKKST